MLAMWIWLLVFTSIGFSAEPSSWDQLARRAFSEDPVASRKAWEELHRIPDLESQLRAGLQSAHRAESLKVIQAMKISAIFPDLRKMLQTQNDAFVWDTAIAISNDEEKKGLFAILRQSIEGDWEGLTDSAKRTVLDAAFQLKAPVSVSSLKAILSDASYEARVRAVRLAGALARRNCESPDAGILSLAARGKPYQLRLEALRQMSDLGPACRSRLGISVDDCRLEAHPEVRALCDALTFKGSAGK